MGSRNKVFCVGLVLLFLGLEARSVDSAVLTPEFTAYLAKQSKHPAAALNDAAQAINPEAKPLFKTTFKPPEWLGWTLLMCGAVAICHSLGLPKQ